MSTKEFKLPHSGVWLRAPERHFEEVALFVHHYEGHRASVRKHQEFLAELGMDSVAFTLSFPQTPKWLSKVAHIENYYYQLRNRWSEEISDMLKAIPAPKILYTFSFPSAPALQALAEMQSRSQIRTWICDGGPFLMNFKCFWNYYTKHEKVKNPLFSASRLALGLFGLQTWSLATDLKLALQQLPEGFPILSIRSWQDPLVPIEAIDAVFRGQSHLQLETLTLPEAGHIDGLQRFPLDYKPRVEKFLRQQLKVSAPPSNPQPSEAKQNSKSSTLRAGH